MSQPSQCCSRAEWRTCLAVLVGLLAVAVGVLLKQSSFNPAVLAAQSAAPKNAPAPLPDRFHPDWLPPELVESGPPETFTPDTLYDKIDGKAELYLSAGFVRLDCRRFALRGAPDEWFEWFTYGMGGMAQAFSVFSTQRRAEGQPLDLAEYAYKTQNALYFVCGSNYVEAVAATSDEALLKAMLSMAGRFVGAAALPPGGARMTQFELFPPENLRPESRTLQSENAFGFDQFKDVFTVEYTVGDAKVLAFLTSCTNEAAATSLRDAYRAFLIENGGKELPATAGGTTGKPVEILDAIEIVFSKGRFVAGIHAAADVSQAESTATRLRERIAGEAK